MSMQTIRLLMGSLLVATTISCSQHRTNTLLAYERSEELEYTLEARSDVKETERKLRKCGYRATEPIEESGGIFEGFTYFYVSGDSDSIPPIEKDYWMRNDNYGNNVALGFLREKSYHPSFWEESTSHSKESDGEVIVKVYYASDGRQEKLLVFLPVGFPVNVKEKIVGIMFRDREHISQPVPSSID